MVIFISPILPRIHRNIHWAMCVCVLTGWGREWLMRKEHFTTDQNWLGGETYQSQKINKVSMRLILPLESSEFLGLPIRYIQMTAARSVKCHLLDLYSAEMLLGVRLQAK